MKDKRIKSVSTIKQFTYGILSLFMIIIAMILFQGCSLQEQYKSLVIERGIVHFSLEYPSNFSLIQDITDSRTSLMFKGPADKNNPRERARTHINLFVIRIDNPQSMNTDTLIKEKLRIVSVFPNYHLIERSPLNVSTSQGEQIVYSFSAPPPVVVQPGYIPDAGPVPIISRDVYFEQQGLIWEIQIESNASNAEADKIIFEQLLRTFKILN